jgi:putative transposase
MENRVGRRDCAARFVFGNGVVFGGGAVELSAGGWFEVVLTPGGVNPAPTKYDMFIVMYTDEYFIESPRRKRMRLAGCDYSREGPYFVTICTYKKECILGAVTGDVVTLTVVGQAVRETWLGLAGRFSTLVLDEFIVMPNHVHGVLGFVGAGFTPPCVGTEVVAAAKQDRRPSLSDVICAFKALSMRAARLKGHVGMLWQRGYYEHIVRDGEDMRNVQRYIVENPARWGMKAGN